MKKQQILLVCMCLLLCFNIFSNEQIDAQTVYANEQEGLKKEIEKIQSDEAGTYTIDITYYDQLTEQILNKRIYFTLEGDNTVIDDEIVINANNVTVNVFDVLQLTTEDWIQLTKARAWQKKDNSSIEISHVDISSLRAETGKYSIEFTTVNNLKTRSEITVVFDTIEVNHQINNVYTVPLYLSKYEKIFFYIIFFFWGLILCGPIILILFQYRNIRKLVLESYELLKKSI